MTEFLLLWASLVFAGFGGAAFQRKSDLLGTAWIIAATLCQVPAYSTFLTPVAP